MGYGMFANSSSSGRNRQTKQMSYAALKQLMQQSNNSSANDISTYYCSKGARLGGDDYPLSEPADSAYKFDLSDQQLDEYIQFLLANDGRIPYTQIAEFNMTGAQIKKLINVYLNFEIQSPAIVSQILGLLRHFYNFSMGIDFLKETLEKIDLFPTSEAEYTEIINNGYSERQKEYFSFFKWDTNRTLLGKDSKEIEKDIVFTTFIKKAEELRAEEMVGPNWFRFFEAYYSDLIDEELFNKYKDQLTSIFILRHPNLYKELELRKDVKGVLKTRLKRLIDRELGTYGYPEGLIKVNIKIHDEEIQLYRVVNEDEEDTLTIEGCFDGEECEKEDSSESLLYDINGDEKEDDSDSCECCQ